MSLFFQYKSYKRICILLILVFGVFYYVFFQERSHCLPLMLMSTLLKKNHIPGFSFINQISWVLVLLIQFILKLLYILTLECHWYFVCTKQQVFETDQRVQKDSSTSGASGIARLLHWDFVHELIWEISARLMLKSLHGCVLNSSSHLYVIHPDQR